MASAFTSGAAGGFPMPRAFGPGVDFGLPLGRPFERGLPLECDRPLESERPLGLPSVRPFDFPGGRDGPPAGGLERPFAGALEPLSAGGFRFAPASDFQGFASLASGPRRTGVLFRRCSTEPTPCSLAIRSRSRFMWPPTLSFAGEAPPPA